MNVYWQQRMIDDAVVEGDFIVYQYDNDGKLLKREETLAGGSSGPHIP